MTARICMYVTSDAHNRSPPLTDAQLAAPRAAGGREQNPPFLNPPSPRCRTVRNVPLAGLGQLSSLHPSRPLVPRCRAVGNSECPWLHAALLSDSWEHRCVTSTAPKSTASRGRWRKTTPSQLNRRLLCIYDVSALSVLC